MYKCKYLFLTQDIAAFLISIAVYSNSVQQHDMRRYTNRLFCFYKLCVPHWIN